MNVDIWQRWRVGTVTTRRVVAQMLTSDMDRSRRGRASSKPGHVRYARMATKLRIAAK